MQLTRVHPYVVMRSVNLLKANTTKATIHIIINREGYHVSYKTVQAICSRYIKSGSFGCSKPGKFREYTCTVPLESNL